MSDLFPPTRAAALERLEAFAPKAGRAYASGRNTDVGPGNATAVSMLSPYLRRRMITEHEVVEAVLKHHTPEAAEKYIQEVFWRTYWKGWLEMRPTVWQHYLASRNHAFTQLEKDGALRRDYEEAITGTTGIDGFDDWAQELVQTGWLHNHARMWFASIWIFTLRLPWALGADFFYKHLLDADPASNTLSWRWVGGLHTRGKTYLARAENIEKYTNGRFRPTNLAPFAEPLIEDGDIPAPLPPRDGHARVPDGDYVLLVTNEDMHPQSLPGFNTNPPKLMLYVDRTSTEAGLNAGKIASVFTEEAFKGLSANAVANSQAVSAEFAPIRNSIPASGTATVALAFTPVGPTHTNLSGIRAKLTDDGLTIHEIKRSWDQHGWPHATRGFFKLKQKIPKLLGQAGLA